MIRGCLNYKISHLQCDLCLYFITKQYFCSSYKSCIAETWYNLLTSD